MPRMMPQFQGATLGELTMPRRRQPMMPRNTGFGGGGLMPIGPSPQPGYQAPQHWGQGWDIGIQGPPPGGFPTNFPLPPGIGGRMPAPMPQAGAMQPMQQGGPMTPDYKQLAMNWANRMRGQY